MNNTNSNTLDSNNVSDISEEQIIDEPDENGYFYNCGEDGDYLHQVGEMHDFSEEGLRKELANHLKLLPKYENERQEAIKKDGYYHIHNEEIELDFLHNKVKFTFTKEDLGKYYYECIKNGLLHLDLFLTPTIKFEMGLILVAYGPTYNSKYSLNEYGYICQNFAKDNKVYSLLINYFSEDEDQFPGETQYTSARVHVIEFKEVR